MTFNDAFSLSNATPEPVGSSNVVTIGSVVTPTFNGTGTYQTGAIDLGTGYDEIGVGIWMVGDGVFGDTVTLGSIEAVAVPEPSTYALLAGLFCLGLGLLRRRRK